MTDQGLQDQDPRAATGEQAVAAGRADETTAVPVVTAPVAVTPSDPGAVPTARRGGRLRWLIALAAVVLVVVTSGIITLALTGASPKATVLGYVPADSVMYGEVRLDLPGDQRQKIGSFLSKFPGFADQAALDTKIDEVLDRLVSSATSGKQTFAKDIKPWFGGELGFSMGPSPSVSPATDPSAFAASTRALLLLSVTDEALARTWFTNAMSTAGVTGTPLDFEGTSLTVFADPKVPQLKAAFALIGGKVAVAGDLASVQAAVSTKGSSPLASQPTFSSALAATDSDHLGFVFLDTHALMTRFASMSSTLGGASASPAISQALLDLIPDWTAATLRAEGDALVMDAVLPHKDGAPGPSDNRTGRVAAYAPPSTVALLSANDYGKTLLDTIALYRKEPQFAAGIKSIDDAAGILGGLDSAIGWMGDSGLVVDTTSSGVEGGLVVIPKDGAAAQKLVTTIRSFIALGGAQQGISSTDETYAGTTITTVDLGDISKLFGAVGGMTGMPAAPAPSGPAGETVKISFAATDAVVAVGSSADFVKHVLDAGPGASLADDARFSGLAARAGAQDVSLSYVDITAVRTQLEKSLADAPADQRTQYETTVKPFLVPFDALISSNVRDGALDRSHLIITVK